MRIHQAASSALLLLSSFSLHAQVVVKDHVSDSSLWNEVGLISCFAINTLALDCTVSAFTGNGGAVTKVGMIISNHVNGIPNPTGWWQLYDYDVVFYQDIAAFQNDPLNPTQEVTFDTPANLGHDIPVGTYTNNALNVFELYYFEFDVASAAITTTLGAEHFIAIRPREAVTAPNTGVTLCAYSNNGPGAVGGGFGDWYFNNFGNPLIGPDLLANLGWPAYDHVAHKIELAQPAATTIISTSCVGPFGPMSLTGNLPALATTFASSADGFGPTSFAISVLGYSQAALPLGAVLPIGIAGCELLASPDSLEMSLPVAGVSGYQLSIPANNALLGAQLYHQFLQLELDAQATLVSLSGSNGLALTVGF